MVMRWKIIELPSTQTVYCGGNCKTAYDLYRILCLCPRLDRIWSVPDLMQHLSSVRRYRANGIDPPPTVSLSSNDAQLLMFMISSDDAQLLMFTIPSDDAQSLMTPYPLSPSWVPNPSFPALFWPERDQTHALFGEGNVTSGNCEILVVDITSITSVAAPWKRCQLLSIVVFELELWTTTRPV